MAKKTDAQMVLFKEILAELRRLNTNLERHANLLEITPTEHNESEDMDEFE